MMVSARARLASTAGVVDHVGTCDFCCAGGYYLSQELAHVRAMAYNKERGLDLPQQSAGGGGGSARWERRVLTLCARPHPPSHSVRM